MRSATTAGALLLVAFLVLGVTVSGPPTTVDETVAGALGADWRGTAGRVAGVLSAVLGPVLPVAAALGLLVAAFAVPRHRGLLLRLVLLLAVCRSVSLVKPLFERTRPRPYPDFSFPSGHVVSVASVGFVAVVLSAWLAARHVRRVAVLSATAVVVAAVCRMVLDVHWFTDVLGGAVGVVGLGLLTAAALRLLPAHGVRSGP